VELNEFRRRVQDALAAIHATRTANAPDELQAGPSDLREVLSIVRSAAEEIILCASVDEAIARLKQDQLRLVLVDWVANFDRTDSEKELTVQLAHAKDSQDTPALPCFAFCSYLIELCDRLKPGKQPE
jgi:hypothetical protein